MFADLPKPLQEKVLEYLQENNPAAKMLYDEYHRQRVQQQLKSSLNNTKQTHADTTS